MSGSSDRLGHGRPLARRNRIPGGSKAKADGAGVPRSVPRCQDDEVISGPSSSVHRHGWQESLGAVFLAGSAACAAGGLARHFVPKIAATPFSSFAVGVVVFVAALWGITVFLIPGRRPSSISVRWGAIAWSVAAGLFVASIAVGSTWAYLSSIEIDDGLEGVIFLPILVAASTLVALAARSWSGQFRPILGAVAACVGVAVAATAHAWSRPAGPSVLPLYTLTVVVLLPLTLSGVAVGTAVGDYFRKQHQLERDQQHSTNRRGDQV